MLGVQCLASTREQCHNNAVLTPAERLKYAWFVSDTGVAFVVCAVSAHHHGCKIELKFIGSSLRVG